MLQPRKIKVLEVTSEDGEGIEQYGVLPKIMSIPQLYEQVRQTFELQDVQIHDDVGRQVQRIAISPGVGNNVISHVPYKQCDVLITSNISRHVDVGAVAQGLAVIDAEHYGIEYISIQGMTAFPSEKLKSVKTISTPLCHPLMIM